MHAHDLTAFRKHLRIYVGVFLALLVGTLVTVAVSYIPFGHAGNITVALAIALLKAGLVAGFFMHLVSEKRSIYTLLVCTGFFFLGLMVLTLWAMQDHPDLAFRSAPPPPAAVLAHHVP
jgi:cytochrome c oxidase subunit 4